MLAGRAAVRGALQLRKTASRLQPPGCRRPGGGSAMLHLQNRQPWHGRAAAHGRPLGRGLQQNGRLLALLNLNKTNVKSNNTASIAMKPLNKAMLSKPDAPGAIGIAQIASFRLLKCKKNLFQYCSRLLNGKNCCFGHCYVVARIAILQWLYCYG